MSQYRIPFYGTVLVEAKTLSEAEVSAGTWARSMKQATHGVEMERPTTGKICALDLWIHQAPTDVTDSFTAYRKEFPVIPLDPELEELCRQNYHGEIQCAWELFEQGERVRKGTAQNET